MSTAKISVELAQLWLRLDTNQERRAVVEKALQENDEALLLKHFGRRISFGTAGLRGKDDYGFANMNDITTAQVNK